MVLVLKEVEIDGRIEHYPLLKVPCDLPEMLEETKTDMLDLTLSDVDLLRMAGITVEGDIQ